MHNYSYARDHVYTYLIGKKKLTTFWLFFKEMTLYRVTFRMHVLRAFEKNTKFK